MSAMDLEARYRRMLRWYPRQWRSRNEDAVTGVLLDQAEDEARTAPSISERLSLMAGGLHERFLRAEQLSPLHLATLGTALAFSVWYLASVAWAPGTRFAGTLGPFANPSAITAAILAIALVLTLTGRLQLARVAAVLATGSALTLFTCALALGLLGPGPAPTMVFAGLGVLGALPRGDRRSALALPPAVLLVALAVVAIRSVQQSMPFFFSGQVLIWSAIAIVSSLGALTLALIAANPRTAPTATGS